MKVSSYELAKSSVCFDFSDQAKHHPTLGGLYSHYDKFSHSQSSTFIFAKNPKKENNENNKGNLLISFKKNKGRIEKKVVENVDSASILEVNSGRRSIDNHILISLEKQKGRITIYDRFLRKCFFMGHFKKLGARNKRASYFFRTDTVLEKKEIGSNLVDFIMVKKKKSGNLVPLMVKTFSKVTKKVILVRHYNEEGAENKQHYSIVAFLQAFYRALRLNSLLSLDNFIDFRAKSYLQFFTYGSIKARDNLSVANILHYEDQDIEEFKKYSLKGKEGLLDWVNRDNIWQMGFINPNSKPYLFITALKRGMELKGKVILLNDIEQLEIIMCKFRDLPDEPSIHCLDSRTLCRAQGKINTCFSMKNNVICVSGVNRTNAQRFVKYYIKVQRTAIVLLLTNKYPLSQIDFFKKGKKLVKFVGYSVEGDKNVVKEFKANF